jgi:hypothetical protein
MMDVFSCIIYVHIYFRGYDQDVLPDDPKDNSSLFFRKGIKGDLYTYIIMYCSNMHIYKYVYDI